MSNELIRACPWAKEWRLMECPEDCEFLDGRGCRVEQERCLKCGGEMSLVHECVEHIPYYECSCCGIIEQDIKVVE